MEELYQMPYTKDGFTIRRQFWLSRKWDAETYISYTHNWWWLHEQENTPVV